MSVPCNGVCVVVTTRVCGYVMFSVMSVCLSVCLSVCSSVQTITFEPLHIETSFLVCRYIFTISRSSLSIKVIGSRSYEKNDNFYLFQHVNPLYMDTGH